MSKGIEKKVTNLLADKLSIDAKKIKPESKLIEDLGMDSFLAVEFNFELKQKFEINISQEELIRLRTVKDVIELLSKKAGGKK